MQILPARALLRLRRVRRRLPGLQKSAREPGGGDGIAYAKEYHPIQTRWFRLYAQYGLLWDRWNLVHCLWCFPTPVAGIAGSGLFYDRLIPALRSDRKLFGEQEV